MATPIIEIRKPYYNDSVCCMCNEKATVDLTFGKKYNCNESAIVITLCNQCITDLKDKLLMSEIFCDDLK